VDATPKQTPKQTLRPARYDPNRTRRFTVRLGSGQKEVCAGKLCLRSFYTRLCLETGGSRFYLPSPLTLPCIRVFRRQYFGFPVRLSTFAVASARFPGHSRGCLRRCKQVLDTYDPLKLPYPVREGRLLNQLRLWIINR
jgi:hypothetical protein